MEVLAVVARVVLAATFIVSGVAKLIAPGTAAAFREFGVPRQLAASASLLVPAMELSAALLLLPAITAWWGAWLGTALIGAFSAGIGANLVIGRSPDCHCFGVIAASRAGWSALLRNAALLALAVSVLVGGKGQPSLVSWIGELNARGSVLIGALIGSASVAMVLAALGAGIWLLWRRQGRIMTRLDELERGRARSPKGLPQSRPTRSATVRRGSVAPDFTLPDLSGRSTSLIPADPSVPTLLVFTDPGCRPCGALMPDVAAWQRRLEGRMTVTVVSNGSIEATRELAETHGLTNVRMQEGFEVSEAFDARGMPAALAVGRSGRIASEVATGGARIRALMTNISGVLESNSTDVESDVQRA